MGGLRVHMFFLLLLAMSVSYTGVAGINGSRGFALWLLLVFAVLVREGARALTMAWFGLDVRGLLLLPTGALPTYASREDTERAATGRIQLWLALAGPLANFAAGLLLAGLLLAMSPEIRLSEVVGRPLITPSYLLRSMVWMQVLLGAINLLPAMPLDGGRMLRAELTRLGGGLQRARLALQVGQAAAIGVILAGFLTNSLWLMMMGFFIIIGSRMEDQGVRLETNVSSVKMRDVMLTEFSTISASATLEDAVEQARHTLQDVFPVVRGGNMVGAAARQNILEALESTGNGYVQGIMTRTFQTAAPGDSLIATLNRVTNAAGASSQLVPVVDGERIVGIITPQNLQRAMGLMMRKAGRGRMQDGDEID